MRSKEEEKNKNKNKIYSEKYGIIMMIKVPWLEGYL